MFKRLIYHIPFPILNFFEHYLLAKYSRALRFLETCDPDFLHTIADKKALYIFKKAVRDVPAYQKFLKQQRCNPEEITITDKFNQLVPITNKKNYIQQYSYGERCALGRLPSCGNIDESSGSSGTPTNWIRSIQEEDLLFKVAEFEFNYIYKAHKQHFIVLSAWSCGPWATGIKFCQMMEHYALVKNTDTNVANVIETMKTFGKEKHYLIAGYPPFLKHLIDSGKINWKSYHVDLLTGGEGTTLEWKAYMKKKLRKGAIIISSYGASDIDIGIGFETPLAHFIRSLCRKNKQLHYALFRNLTTIPMIFQYNPTMHYITNYYNNKEKKHEFIITLLDENVASPKVKYNLHDEGGVYGYKEMIGIVKKYQSDYLSLFRKNKNVPEEILHLPFLFVTGRTDGTISLDGANVYPHQIELCLQKDKSIMNSINHFKITKAENKKRNTPFLIKVELKKGMNPMQKMKQDIYELILNNLVQMNADYKESYEKNKEAIRPHIRLYRYNAWEFAKHKSSVKKKYID